MAGGKPGTAQQPEALPSATSHARARSSSSPTTRLAASATNGGKHSNRDYAEARRSFFLEDELPPESSVASHQSSAEDGLHRRPTHYRLSQEELLREASSHPVSGKEGPAGPETAFSLTLPAVREISTRFDCSAPTTTEDGSKPPAQAEKPWVQAAVTRLFQRSPACTPRTCASTQPGIDIDPRAVQIAALALWMRAQRAYNGSLAASVCSSPRRTSSVAWTHARARGLWGGNSLPR